MAVKNKDGRDEFFDSLADEAMRDGLNGRESDDDTDEWARLAADSDANATHKKKKKRRRRE